MFWYVACIAEGAAGAEVTAFRRFGSVARGVLVPEFALAAREALAVSERICLRFLLRRAGAW